jgi:plasmid stabilization system protein ParE
MVYRVVLSPDAKRDIRSALQWYFQQDIHLPLRFSVELKTVLKRIARHPKQFPVLKGEVRRARMKRFPYFVHYTTNANKLIVVAVMHQRRLNPLHRP